MSASRLGAGLACCLLAGCGFSPLYGDDGAATPVSAQLEQVQVAQIPERTGQMLHDTLQDDMQRDGAPVAQLYTLTVDYNINQQGDILQELKDMESLKLKRGITVVGLIRNTSATHHHFEIKEIHNAKKKDDWKPGESVFIPLNQIEEPKLEVAA